MARREFKLEVLEAFTGGLNLRSDQFNLAENESPDLLNVLLTRAAVSACAMVWIASTRLR